MKLTSVLLLPLHLAALTLAQATESLHSYKEHLELLPLANHHLHADFFFNSSTPLSAYESHNYRYFPRSLAQILQHTHTVELHLRFALGRWDDDQWGPRPRGGSREGGTGVELWAWIDGNSEIEIEERWQALVNSLSGLFCASLNFVDSTKTTRPVLTFEPEGDFRTGESPRLMHGMLPREVVCTENLTPFLKLLPCKGKAGISSLLDGHKLFDSTWQSMSIDVRRRCSGTNDDCALEIEQGISMALSIPRSMRNRHDPIPRPPPIEEVECEEKWQSHDSCFPRAFNGEMAWSLSEVFGHPVRGKCQVGSEGEVGADVSLVVPHEREINIIGSPQIRTVIGERDRQYTLDQTSNFDLNATRQDKLSRVVHSSSRMHISRQLTGHGQERGGMQAVLSNRQSVAQRVVYFESLPWFLRPYMHTLKVEGATIEGMYYTPLIDRKRGTHLELVLEIPAESTATLHYDIEKAILRYTEYPPDANRGFDVGAAVVRLLPIVGEDQSGAEAQYMRTTSLLLPLPTPDFSMPYNVIILTSTVIALGFGSIFNLLVRRFVLLEEVPKSVPAIFVQNLVKKIRARFAKSKEEVKQAASVDKHAPGATNGGLTKDDPSDKNDGLRKRA